jgi:hypothetical protein
MLRRVALVRTEVSEERSASITRVSTIGEIVTTLAINSISSQRSSIASYGNAAPSSWILVTLMMQALRSSESSVYKSHTA